MRLEWRHGVATTPHGFFYFIYKGEKYWEVRKQRGAEFIWTAKCLTEELAMQHAQGDWDNHSDDKLRDTLNMCLTSLLIAHYKNQDPKFQKVIEAIDEALKC